MNAYLTSGNAIYNITDPLMQYLLKQLEGEAVEQHNEVPFDLRMIQIVMDTFGQKKNLLNDFLFDFTKSSTIEMKNAPNKRHYQGIKESNVIANYGISNYLLSFIMKLKLSIVL